ncbi:hypothetical protein CLOBOL_02088 [Enterocloster bolteae ATCC BAA-613]|uniref:Uncharacterized protein n=1 Tax=Enterocloster bolteae (strain ATCC BAA-613 / DSM 15670 / CCUG 46953 / JCM 12243 / WAL 16351) TaxID=411902 RepID=A8RN35_ENTBW|nr:hypothetical protein CLOBOL_02088 [Enterocloster bolteae ATCC BAA-613]
MCCSSISTVPTPPYNTNNKTPSGDKDITWCLGTLFLPLSESRQAGTR